MATALGRGQHVGRTLDMSMILCHATQVGESDLMPRATSAAGANDIMMDALFQFPQIPVPFWKRRLFCHPTRIARALLWELKRARFVATTPGLRMIT